MEENKENLGNTENIHIFQQKHWLFWGKASLLDPTILPGYLLHSKDTRQG